jgi:hypothetical protein
MERLARWREAGAITNAQYDALSLIVLKERFSVFLELNALLYIGVLSLAAGLAWTVQTYFANLGDALVLTTLSALLALSIYYCYSRSLPFSAAEVESPNLIFDYVLYAGCLIFSLELGYIETRFDLLRDAWDHYLLVAAAVFFYLSYRFDNRLVLSLALSSLAAWFGLRFSRIGLLTAGSIRAYALLYGALVAGAGVALHRVGLKPHFTETYLHVAANVVFIALLSGVGAGSTAYLVILIPLCILAAYAGVRFHRLAFFAYGILYGYAGISSRLLPQLSETEVLTYFLVTGALVVLAIVTLARRFGRES